MTTTTTMKPQENTVMQAIAEVRIEEALKNARKVYVGFNAENCKKELSAKGLEFMTNERFAYMYALRMTSELETLADGIKSIDTALSELETAIAEATGDELEKLQSKRASLQIKRNEKISRQREVTEAKNELAGIELEQEKYIAIRAYVANYTKGVELHNAVEINTEIEKLRHYMMKHNENLLALSAGKKEKGTKVDYIEIRNNLQSIVSKILVDSNLFSDLKVKNNFVAVICGKVTVNTSFKKNSVLKDKAGVKIADSSEILKTLCQLIVLEVEKDTNITI